MSNLILDVKNISKSFKNHLAVNDVSFQVFSGEILGFLGPNGAGKTTSIKIITGLINSDSGNVVICGHNIKTDFEKALTNVGAIVETPHLYENLSGLDNIKIFSNLYKNVTKENIEKAISISGLKNRLTDKVKNYSLGMKQRLSLAIVIMHNPALLILDEPTNGLDPIGIKALREFLKDLAHNKNIAVLVSSHILTEMELLCDRVAIITDGTIRAVKSMDEVNKDSSLEELFISTAGEDNLI